MVWDSTLGIPIERYVNVVGFLFSPPPPPPPPTPMVQQKFVHDFMFFVLCIVIQLCNAYTYGLPDDEHMMFKTCRKHEELN